MFVSYSASYDWLLLARLRHYHKGMYYGCKLTHAQTFSSGVNLLWVFCFLVHVILNSLLYLKHVFSTRVRL